MDPKDLPGGGPAFPCDPFIASKPGHESVAKRLAEGMTLRDHFAGLALGGLMADPGIILSGGKKKEVALLAYEMADAMLEARGA